MNVSLMDSIRLIGNATIHIGGDSFSNHTTHMTGTPAVILWGSTQVSAVNSAGSSQLTSINNTATNLQILSYIGVLA